jgi:hypothetical protein
MIKKALKKIGKGIKTGFKSIGKAFKKVFKGIGKFIGKLGPIGMLGMMLIMPQLGAWWGQFGTWAGTLGKGFGSVMRGIHWAGAKVGTAYSTVTGGIKRALNAVTGGSWAAAGTAEYQAGLSDKFANWMSGQLDKGRDFLGLETATPIGTPDVDVTDVVPDTTTVPDTTIIPDTETITSAYSASDQQVIDQMKAFSDYPNLQESLTSNLSPEGLEMYKGTTVSRYDEKGFLKDPDSYKSPSDFAAKDVAVSDDFGTLGEGERIIPAGDDLGKRLVSAMTGKDDISTWNKIVDVGKQGYTMFKTGKEIVETFADDPYDIETGWNNYIADNMVGYYESANVDWLNQGFAGQPSWGIGNSNYFQSVANYSNNDPYYQYLIRTA